MAARSGDRASSGVEAHARVVSFGVGQIRQELSLLSPEEARTHAALLRDVAEDLADLVDALYAGVPIDAGGELRDERPDTLRDALVLPPNAENGSLFGGAATPFQQTKPSLAEAAKAGGRSVKEWAEEAPSDASSVLTLGLAAPRVDALGALMGVADRDPRLDGSLTPATPDSRARSPEAGSSGKPIKASRSASSFDALMSIVCLKPETEAEVVEGDEVDPSHGVLHTFLKSSFTSNIARKDEGAGDEAMETVFSHSPYEVEMTRGTAVSLVLLTLKRTARTMRGDGENREG